MIVPSLGQLWTLKKFQSVFNFSILFIYLLNILQIKKIVRLYLFGSYTPGFSQLQILFLFHLFSLFSFFLFPFFHFPLLPVSLSIKNYFRIRLSLLLSLLSNSKIFIIYSKPFFPPFFFILLKKEKNLPTTTLK